jgi:hypothetical protein
MMKRNPEWNVQYKTATAMAYLFNRRTLSSKPKPLECAIQNGYGNGIPLLMQSPVLQILNGAPQARRHGHTLHARHA